MAYTQLLFTFMISTLQIKSERINCNPNGGTCRCPSTAPTPGERCVLDCNNIDVCIGSTLQCRTGTPCLIQCTATKACYAYATIETNGATDLTVICDGTDACKEMNEISCGSGECELQCLGDTACDEPFGGVDASNADSFQCITDQHQCPSTVPDAFTSNPTPSPTITPSESPTKSPSGSPSRSPSRFPTKSPSESPSISSTTASPTRSPSELPSESPSKSPSRSPTRSPSKSPTELPSESPSESLTEFPTTMNPTNTPTMAQTLASTSKRSLANSIETTRIPSIATYEPTSPSVYITNSIISTLIPIMNTATTIEPTYNPTMNQYTTAEPTYRPSLASTNADILTITAQIITPTPDNNEPDLSDISDDIDVEQNNGIPTVEIDGSALILMAVAIFIVGISFICCIGIWCYFARKQKEIQQLVSIKQSSVPSININRARVAIHSGSGDNHSFYHQQRMGSVSPKSFSPQTGTSDQVQMAIAAIPNIQIEHANFHPMQTDLKWMDNIHTNDDHEEGNHALYNTQEIGRVAMPYIDHNIAATDNHHDRMNEHGYNRQHKSTQSTITDITLPTIPDIIASGNNDEHSPLQNSLYLNK